MYILYIHSYSMLYIFQTFSLSLISSTYILLLLQDNSYFSISRFPEETFINVKIQVVERPRLYFRYMSDRNIVITDIFRQEEEASYIFELASLSDCKVHFVDSTECK